MWTLQINLEGPTGLIIGLETVSCDSVFYFGYYGLCLQIHIYGMDPSTRKKGYKRLNGYCDENSE